MFCRFLELYLVSAFHAACAIGIIATNIAVRQASKRESGGPGYAYGIVGHPFQGHRGRNRLAARLKSSRKSRFRCLDLEGLESRTLLATTIPGATATGAPISLTNLSSSSASNNDGSANSPAVVIDPYDSQKIFAVWGVDESQESPVPSPTTAVVEGAYSNNGGATWTSLGESVAPVQRDLTSTASPPTYTQVVDPSVAFNANNDVYVLTLQSTGANDGELYLTEFDFNAATPTAVALPNNGVVYHWLPGSDAATSPVVAVDTGLAASDPFVNNVYIAWASIDTLPAAAPGDFNPNRAELMVGTPISSFPNAPANAETLAFSGVTTVNAGGNNGGAANNGNDDSHPQLVINQNENGEVTVAWDDFGSDIAAPADLLVSNLVQAGDTYGFIGTTGIILPGTAGNSSPGNWGTAVIYAAGLASSTAPADPVGIATEVSVNGGTTDVNGDGKDDVIVADQGTSQIGVALNSGTGTLGATTVVGTVGSPSGVSLGDLVSGHSKANILDAATSNGASAGGVSVNANGTNPTDGEGNFLPAQALSSVTGGSAEVAIVTADVDGNGVADLVAADPGNNSIDIWLNPSTSNSSPISLVIPIAGFDPVAVIVAKFRGTTSNSDIAILSSNGTIGIFQNNITAGNPVTSADFTYQTITTIASAVSMTSGAVSGNASLPDLIVTRNDPGQNALLVAQNLSTSTTLSFANATQVQNSILLGTPVGGEQGVAVGTLSTNGNYSAYQDIAVLYKAAGSTTVPANESMVAVFQNLDNGQFRRTQNAGVDFDAGQENPTAIALLHLTNSATLPFEDIVVTNNDNFDRTVLAGTISVLAPATTTAITNGTPTTFTDAVSVPDPSIVNNLTVTIDLTDQQSVANLSLVLVVPSTGDQITLVQNQNNAAGTANPSVGLPGGNAIGQYGYAPGTPPTLGTPVGTIFDGNATRNIYDPTTTGTNGNSATDYIGFFRPEGSNSTDTLPSLGEANTLANFVALERAKGAINGTWDLVITNFTSTAPAAGRLIEFNLQFSTGMTKGTPTRIASTAVVGGIGVAGALGNIYPLKTPSSPTIGVGPGLVLAVDNTLGSDSPYQGRIYASYVGYYDVIVDGLQNPTTNTDIFLKYSDNGGLTWSTAIEVNDDDGLSDGFSGASESDISNTSPTNPSVGDQVTGRTQFQPAIAVDQATGTLVLSWRDARDNAANALVATYLTASTDGGNTFSAQTYANPAKTAIDAITGQAEVLGPESDNQSAGDGGQANAAFGYGNQMGLAVFDGQVYPVWAGNFNQSTIIAGAVVGEPLNIWYRPMVIAAGLRIVSSSMGPITYAEASSGSLSITVTFDRPITASTFVAGDVQVFFNGVNDAFHTPLTVTGISPSSGTASTFTITVNTTPASADDYTGTYSYVIAPDNGAGLAISAPIESYSGPLVDGKATLRTFEPMDQNADGTPDENALTTAFVGTTPGDVYAVPTPNPSTPVTFLGVFSTGSTVGVLSPPFNQNTLPLIVPGPQILSTSVPNGDSADGNLINSGTTSTLSVTFDRPIQAGTFTSSQVLSIMGPAGSISGPQYFPSTSSTGQVIPAATSSTSPGTLSSKLTVPSFDGTFKVAHITVQLNAAFSPDSDLTGILIAPNGTQVTLFSGVGGNGSNFINTVFDDSSQIPIASGTAPFTGTYQPTGKLSTLVGATVDMPNALYPSLWVPGTWTLKLVNSATGATGMLDNWSLNITPVITVTPMNLVGGAATTFQIGFPIQQLSGTYTVQLGTGIEGAAGITDNFADYIDTNQNAGLAALQDVDQNDPTTTVRYTATSLPKTIPAPVSGNSSTVSSSITVPDSFVIQGDKTAAGASVMQVQLSLLYPNDPDLTATLYHYDPTGQVLMGQVTLFSGVGQGTNNANFTNTVFDDNSATPIQNGSAPFFATFDPQQSLATVFAPAGGMNVQGIWTLVIQNASTTGGSGTLTGWSLTFQKPLPTTGLGQPGSDIATASFRIFTLSQADAASSQAWTSVGAAAANAASNTGAGEVSAIAVDPSDPSGNTVYAAGSSGGIWKTTNFLATSANGPTWIPLTNFGPSSGINIGAITVFARNSDPNESIIIAATGSATSGENNTALPGVGFLISQDGGATWNLYDSTDNIDASGNILPINSASRNREFVGTIAYAVTVDPQLSPTGQVIIYAALSGANGGIWRSEDTGQTWVQMLAGNATSVVLNPNSGTVLNPTTGTNVQGNLQVVYAGFASPTGTTGAAAGVYLSPNQGQVWSLMAGGIGNPLIIDNTTGADVNPVTNPSPNGVGGRITLAVPAPNGNAVQDAIYSGWLYAAVVTPSGGFDGLFVTKDFGENWTNVGLNTALPANSILAPVSQSPIPFNQGIPTNDITAPSYPITDVTQGNIALSLIVDPTDPSIVYLGSFGGDGYNSDTGLIRVNTTNLWDAHSLVAYYSFANNGGALTLNSTGPAGVNNVLYGTAAQVGEVLVEGASYLNYIRNPLMPFMAEASTLHVANYANFTNNGAGATWTAFDMPGTGYQTAVAIVDPATGLPRLIFGSDTGIWSALDDNGSIETTIGGIFSAPSVNRNGNLQLAQFYYGAVQPSTAAAEVAGALFYGGAQNLGAVSSTAGILTTGDLQWSINAAGQLQSAAGVATDQQGSGTVFNYLFPYEGGDYAYTNFFQVNGIGRTFGLFQAAGGDATPDPQWLPEGVANIAVDPVNDQDAVISSSTGRIFSTNNEGVTWFDIGDPAVFGSPGNYSVALAYGAPDPAAPEGIGNLGNFIYVGTQAGQIYVTQDGGGSGTSNNWINISTGLDGTAVEQIITDPTRGSHDAYAVTTGGVFYMANSIASASNPTPTWVNITGNLKTLVYSIFGQTYNPASGGTQPYDLATALSSIIADWRYAIPINPSNLSEGYHPVLYVGGSSGVYQSLNNGTTWTFFPDTTYGALVEGGNLPHNAVTSLSTSLGDIDTNTGMPVLAGPYAQSTTNRTTAAAADPDLLMATTYGQGAFAINLAPLILGNAVTVSPTTSGTGSNASPVVTGPVTIGGSSEISAFGNATWITVEDVTNPTDPIVIAGFNPADAVPTPSSSNSTNALGNFSIPFDPASFYTTNGAKTIEVFATDAAGSVGNMVTYSFNLNDPNLPQPPPTAPPSFSQPLAILPADIKSGPGVTPPVTNLTQPVLIGTTNPGVTLTVFEFRRGKREFRALRTLVHLDRQRQRLVQLPVPESESREFA